MLGSPGRAGWRGYPAGQDSLERADVLECAPGRWSPSRLGRPPRWLLAAIAVLVLAGGVTASVWGGTQHDPAQLGRRSAQTAASSATCIFIVRPIGGPDLPRDTHKALKGVDCAPPRTGQNRPGVSRPGSSAICVGLHVQARHPAMQFGVRHRCYPGLT